MNSDVRGQMTWDRVFSGHVILDAATFETCCDNRPLKPVDAFEPGIALAIKERTCAHGKTCGTDKLTFDSFPDELYAREYLLSGLCPTCQDEVFNCGVCECGPCEDCSCDKCPCPDCMDTYR